MNKKKVPVIISQRVQKVIGYVEGHTLQEINDKAYKLWESKKFCGIGFKETEELSISGEPMIDMFSPYKNLEVVEEKDEDLL